MAVYDNSGNQLYDIANVDGKSLLSAYYVSGDSVFQRGLKVCTYNVGGWYIGTGENVPASLDNAYYALQNGIIDRINADILCINEFWTAFSASGRTAASLLSQYYQYIETRDGGTKYAGHAICSKYPISSYTQHYFSGETTRYYDDAVITIDSNPVHVIVTHLHPSDSDIRVAEATELCNYVKTLADPFIICGDFNNGLHDPFTELNHAIYDQFINYGCSLANGGAFGIFKTYCNGTDWANVGSALDNIIVSSAITITSVGTDTTKTDDSIVDVIDHIPLFATMSL